MMLYTEKRKLTGNESIRTPDEAKEKTLETILKTGLRNLGGESEVIKMGGEVSISARKVGSSSGLAAKRRPCLGRLSLFFFIVASARNNSEKGCARGKLKSCHQR
jgi:hypothetical protein